MSDRMLEAILLVFGAGVLAMYALVATVLGSDYGASLTEVVADDLGSFPYDISLGLVALIVGAASLAAGVAAAIWRRIHK